MLQESGKIKKMIRTTKKYRWIFAYNSGNMGKNIDSQKTTHKQSHSLELTSYIVVNFKSGV